MVCQRQAPAAKKKMVRQRQARAAKKKDGASALGPGCQKKRWCVSSGVSRPQLDATSFLFGQKKKTSSFSEILVGTGTRARLHGAAAPRDPEYLD